jgi:small conductance mechanosensitive channel
LCHRVYEITGQKWLAESSYWVVVKPIKIVLIVIIAIVLRWIVHRSIGRLVNSTAKGGVPAILKPLRERLPDGVLEASTVFPERRSQRAAAIGSVLRSAATLAIFTVAVLMVLNELSLNLAPLLASAGVVGVALGFGAQSLVKDILAGLFMLLEDQYGVGDVVDVGDTVGTVEAVGLRITTLRDMRGVLWYVRNGEIVKVGNKSQGWANVIVDMPIGHGNVEEATAVMRRVVEELASDPQYSHDFIESPEVVGVESVGIEGTVVRTTAQVHSEDSPRMSRVIRQRLTEALEAAGLTSQISGGRRFPGGPAQPSQSHPADPSGAT